MRTAFISSLLFALLTSASVAVTAAPAPAVVETPTNTSIAPSTAQTQTSDTVNINSADAETLQKVLVGIGNAKAAAIVAYREENGPFTSIDELIEVKGIGKAILEKNRDRLSIN